MTLKLWILAALPVLCATLAPAHGQERSPAAEVAAKKALNDFIAAWNTADNEALRQTVNYPHVTLAPGRLVIANRPAEFTTDFARMRQRNDWARSSFDSIAVHRSSSSKVHLEAVFSRYRTDGTRYLTGKVMYIVTLKDGHWGMQFRAPAGRPGEAESPAGDALERARQTVLEFFTAFNAADNETLLATLHLPHAFLLGNGNLILGEDRTGPGVQMDFEGLRQREDWHMSSLDSIEATQVSANLVHFELTFSRYHPNGLKYRTVPALWILTRRDNGWGIQFRSLMPPIFSAAQD